MRLINVDAASEIVRFECGKWEGLANTIIKEFYAIKPVDAVQVVHGQWETVDRLSDAERYRCSVCGQTWIFGVGDPQFNGMNFCPNCGADMREDGDNG